MTLIRLGNCDLQNIEQLCHSKPRVRQVPPGSGEIFQDDCTCPGFSSLKKHFKQYYQNEQKSSFSDIDFELERKIRWLGTNILLPQNRVHPSQSSSSR